jgi:hypothetical protein
MTCPRPGHAATRTGIASTRQGVLVFREVSSPVAVRRIASLGSFVSAVEMLSQRHKFGEGDLLGAQLANTRPRFAKRFPRLTRALSSPAAPVAGYALQAGVSAATFLWPRHRGLQLAGAATLASLQSVQRFRTPFGGDGADQMQQAINTVLASTALIRNRDRGDDLAMRALALETTISYTASGLVKAVSPVWLKGEAITGVMRTRNYGDQRVFRLVARYPAISKAVSWGTIAVETCFPLVYVLPRPAARAYLVSMSAFHVGIGQFMGLNRFLTAFGATHPAIDYVLAQRQSSARPA